MGLTGKRKTRLLQEHIQAEKLYQRSEELTKALAAQFEELHSQDVPIDHEIETLILKSKEYELNISDDEKESMDSGVVKFRSSGASKCERELFYRLIGMPEDPITMYPYQRRWTRNSSFVHDAVQRDLLYSERYVKEPSFTVERTDEGLPSWEKIISITREFEHNGERFQLRGMMDGILRYKDGSRIGFEFKTKSTTIAQVGDYLLREPMESHQQQTVAYSLLFDIEEFLIKYESVAKDSWNKGADAKQDIRFFYKRVTEEEKLALLDKLAYVASMCYSGEIPEGNLNKCIFCPYKSKCHQARLGGA